MLAARLALLPFVYYRCPHEPSRANRACSVTGIIARVSGFLLILSYTMPVRASESSGEYSLGVGAHVVSSVSQVCQRDMDVIGCSSFWPFVGFDLGGYLKLNNWFAVGLKAYGSKDLDQSESQSHTGETEDRDLWLWRLSTEARFFPSLLPSGVWLGPELGVVFMVDSLDGYNNTGDRILNLWTTQIAPLFGAVLGWDVSINDTWFIVADLRAQLIALGNNPRQLKHEVYSRNFGTSFWIGLGLSGAYRW